VISGCRSPLPLPVFFLSVNTVTTSWLRLFPSPAARALPGFGPSPTAPLLRDSSSVFLLELFPASAAVCFCSGALKAALCLSFLPETFTATASVESSCSSPSVVQLTSVASPGVGRFSHCSSCSPVNRLITPLYSLPSLDFSVEFLCVNGCREKSV
jgi:hypothetical protein